MPSLQLDGSKLFIRDILWFTLAVGLSIGWWLSDRAIRHDLAYYEAKVLDMRYETDSLHANAAGSRTQIKQLEAAAGALRSQVSDLRDDNYHLRLELTLLRAAAP